MLVYEEHLPMLVDNGFRQSILLFIVFQSQIKDYIFYMDSSIFNLLTEQEIPRKTAGNEGEEEKGITAS